MPTALRPGRETRERLWMPDEQRMITWPLASLVTARSHRAAGRARIRPEDGTATSVMLRRQTTYHSALALVMSLVSV